MTPGEKAKAALEALTIEATDAQIAARLTECLMRSHQPNESPPRFVFSIEHDATKAPCPVRADRVHKGYCTIERNDSAWCMAWCADALLKGCTIGRIAGGIRHTCSIAQQRARINRAHERATNPIDEDEIPF